MPKYKSSVGPRLLSGPVGFHFRNATLIGLVLSVVALYGVISTFAATTRQGSLTVTTYEKVGNDLKAKRLPGTGIHLNRACEDNPRTDDVTNSAGNAQFTHCPVDTSSNHRVYKVSVSSVPAGYHMADSKEKDVNVRWVGLDKNDPITNAFFILEKDTPGNSGSSLPTTQPQPQPQTQPQPTPSPTPSDQAEGSIKVITYDYNGGNIRKVGNVSLTVQGVGFGVSDLAHNCRPNTRNTGSDAEVTFTNCYSGLEGLKHYKFANINPPAGYTFRSIHGPDVESNDTIKLLAGQQSTVQVWLTKLPVAGPAAPPSGSGGSGSGGSSTSGSSGGSGPSGGSGAGGGVVPGSNNSGGSTSQGGAGQGEVADVEIDPFDYNPDFDESDVIVLIDDPVGSVSSLIGSADDAGVVRLQWRAGQNNDTFTVERSTDNLNWATVSEDGSDGVFVDTHTAFGTTYYYRVFGVDSLGGLSSPVTVQVATHGFVPNVPTTATTPVAVPSTDGSATATVSADVPQNIACSLPGSPTNSATLGSNYTAGSPTYQLVCKDEDGNILGDINFDIELDVDVSDLGDISSTDDLSGFAESNKLAQFDGSGWNELDGAKPELKKVTKNGKTVILAAYKYSSKNTSPIAVLGVKVDKTKTLATVGITALLTGLVAAAVVFYRQTRRIPQLTPVISGSGQSGPVPGTTIQPAITPATKPKTAAEYIAEASSEEKAE